MTLWRISLFLWAVCSFSPVGRVCFEFGVENHWPYGWYDVFGTAGVGCGTLYRGEAMEPRRFLNALQAQSAGVFIWLEALGFGYKRRGKYWGRYGHPYEIMNNGQFCFFALVPVPTMASWANCRFLSDLHAS